ncbi:MAG: hypothetical protein WKF74_03050 [Pyrinomonadaceae bacterium]
MPKSKQPLLGSEARKAQPKLRMIANGSTTVNVIRSEQCASIAVAKQSLLNAIEPQRGAEAST